MHLITKQYKFCAAHKYWNDKWSEKENQDIFGKDVNIHGHNYLLDITISGPINEDSGFIINLKLLDPGSFLTHTRTHALRKYWLQQAGQHSFLFFSSFVNETFSSFVNETFSSFVNETFSSFVNETFSSFVNHHH